MSNVHTLLRLQPLRIILRPSYAEVVPTLEFLNYLALPPLQHYFHPLIFGILTSHLTF